jgi:hypothetical protein
MSTWGIIGIIYAAAVVAWCFFILCHRDRVMSSNNSKRLNVVFLIVSVLFAPACWLMGLVTLIQEKKRIHRKDWPQPVPKKYRRYLKKDTVFYHNKSMSLASYNKLTGNNVTLEQIYGKRYVRLLSDEDVRQFDTIGSRSSIEGDAHVGNRESTPTI